MTTAPPARKKNQAFVDVPKSPFPLSLYTSRTPVPSTTTTPNAQSTRHNHKENAPLRRVVFGEMAPSDQTPTIKRKLSQSALDDSTPKKQKTHAQAISNSINANMTHTFQVQRFALRGPDSFSLGNNPSEEFPNGSVYCHQCSQRRDVLDSAHCDQVTLKHYKSREPVEKPCRAKYCSKCLKKRYGEEMTRPDAKTPYFFSCPRCRGICNCRSCMKAKGLEPVGKLHPKPSSSKPKDISKPKQPKAAKEPKNIDVEMKDVPKKKKPSTSTTTAKPIVELTKLKHLKSKPSTPSVSGSVTSSTVPKPRGRPKKPPKPTIPPAATWSYIPTPLTYSDMMTRFGIREFVLRFAGLMEPGVALGLAGELDDILGNGGRDGGEIVPWVSEACVKAIVLGLLGMLAREEDLESVKHVQAAVKEIRSTGPGANLTKLWTILSTLRTTLGQPGEHDLDLDEEWLPDPLPAPKVKTAYNTRTTRSAVPSPDAAVNITHPSQFIPVMSALVEAAIRSDVVRESFEEGVSELKGVMKRAREVVKVEDERWAGEREVLKGKSESNDKEKAKEKNGEANANGKEKEKEKAEKEKDKALSMQMKKARDRHKRLVEAVEFSSKIVTANYLPRFAPLGVDADGREYWAASPGARERKGAVEWLGSFDEDGKPKGKGKRRVVKGVTVSEEERRGMGDWSWCVVVWGRPPSGDAVCLYPEEDDEEDDSGSDEEEERKEKKDPRNEDCDAWWGFWDPAEIKKVADWVDWKAGIRVGGEKEGEKESERPLGKGLREYAGLLEWRVKEDRYDVDED